MGFCGMAFLAKLLDLGVPRQQIVRQFVVSFLQRVNYSEITHEIVPVFPKESPATISRVKSSKGDLHLVRKTTQQLLKEINAIYDSVLSVDVRKLHDDQLENLIENAIREENTKDLLYLINSCMKWTRLPARGVSIEVLKYFEKTKQLENLDKFYDFCLTYETSPFPLKLFKVQFYWAEGNADKALYLLDDIHSATRNADDRSDLLACKDLFLSLIADAVGKKSEAVLLKLVSLIETLDDVSILEQAWHELFISQWFSDQQLALDLFRRHACLRWRLSSQTNYVTFLLLRDHNVDSVYRLVELLLSHEMMAECQKVLGLLFDYQCK